MAITGINSLHQDERLVVEELVADDVTASDDLVVGDDVTVGDDLTVTDDALVSGDLQVTGNTSLGGIVLPHTITIALAASTTTDGMDITVSLKTAAGAALGQVNTLILYMSETNSGSGITGDTYSGDLTASEGAILGSLVAKKMWMVNTTGGGVFKGTLVASANPADQYVVAIHPFNGKPVVSAASGTKWEGAA
jgi:hypothetical protein